MFGTNAASHIHQRLLVLRIVDDRAILTLPNPLPRAGKWVFLTPLQKLSKYSTL
jgi:hypothetical protein